MKIYTNNDVQKVNLRDHASAQCHVRIQGDTVEFWSYYTMVIRLTPDTVECTGTYSATTRKQIGWFLREYARQYTYQDMKQIAGCGVQSR